MKEKSTLSFFWKSTVLCLAILMNVTLGYTLLLGTQSVFVWRDLHSRYDALKQDLVMVNERKASLSSQIRSLQTDSSYLETQIRQRLNYVREGEVLYIFENEKVEISPWIDGVEGEIVVN